MELKFGHRLFLDIIVTGSFSQCILEHRVDYGFGKGDERDYAGNKPTTTTKRIGLASNDSKKFAVSAGKKPKQ